MAFPGPAARVVPARRGRATASQDGREESTPPLGPRRDGASSHALSDVQVMPSNQQPAASSQQPAATARSPAGPQPLHPSRPPASDQLPSYPATQLTSSWPLGQQPLQPVRVLCERAHLSAESPPPSSCLRCGDAPPPISVDPAPRTAARIPWHRARPSFRPTSDQPSREMPRRSQRPRCSPSPSPTRQTMSRACRRTTTSPWTPPTTCPATTARTRA